MSASPSNLLTRLDELKKWQEKQQKRLMVQNKKRLDTTDTDHNTIQGLSVFDSSPSQSAIMQNYANSSRLMPQQMKTQECVGDNVFMQPEDNKSKKPFLRRGTGLSRFGMNPGDQKRPFNKQMPRKMNMKFSDKNDSDNISNAKKCNDKHSVDSKIADLTSLNVPDCNIKARWQVVDNNIETYQKPLKNYIEKENKIEDLAREADLIAQINKLTMEGAERSSEISESAAEPNIIVADVLVHNDNSYIPKLSHDSSQCTPSEQSLYEKALEKELLIFEALEQKALHSSFCSTNSSVLRILSSTPNKKKVDKKNADINGEQKEADEIHVVNVDSPSVSPSKKKSVHFEPSGKDAIMKLLHSLQARNFDTNFEHINEEGNALNLCTPDEATCISPHSSINSEDFGEPTVSNVDFKDTECWSDINTCNSSLTENSRSPSTESIESSATACIPKSTEKGTNAPTASERNDKPSADQLAMKLQQLDQEIQRFRKERGKVEKMKHDFEKEQRDFGKEKKAFEKYILDEKIKVEFYLEDEKKKFIKEKMIFDRYVKDVTNKTTRKEREEICALKSELANVKEAAKLKETRSATSQARLRNQIKTLEKENANLKEEVEKLVKHNAKLQAAQKFASRKITETKMLHEINKNLSKLTKDAKVSEQLNKLKKIEETQSTCIENDESDGEQHFVNNKHRTSKEETTGIYEDEHNTNREASLSLNDSFCDYSKTHSKAIYSYRNYMKEVGVVKGNCDEKTEPMVLTESKENDGNGANYDENFKNMTEFNLIKNYEMVFGKEPAQVPAESKEKLRTEVSLVDGSTEVSYSNGNKKVVSPDGNFIVMQYFNGDIKEMRLLDGVVRYYYAENQSWHSTFADGSELLEFSNGQTEKKSKDGEMEITFPNGVIKMIKLNGSEIISYPDGSKVEVDNRGEKVLLLPNGQKEIHNEDHKRREYPDGTVKILYPDGIQETRYSNGRIRIKDKSGKLLLDSFDENT